MFFASSTMLCVVERLQIQERGPGGMGIICMGVVACVSVGAGVARFAIASGWFTIGQHSCMEQGCWGSWDVSPVDKAGARDHRFFSV